MSTELVIHPNGRALVRIDPTDRRELLRLEPTGEDLYDVYFIISDEYLGQFYRWSKQDDFCWAPTQLSVFDSDALVVVAAKLAELSGKAWR